MAPLRWEASTLLRVGHAYDKACCPPQCSGRADITSVTVFIKLLTSYCPLGWQTHALAQASKGVCSSVGCCSYPTSSMLISLTCSWISGWQVQWLHYWFRLHTVTINFCYWTTSACQNSFDCLMFWYSIAKWNIGTIVPDWYASATCKLVEHSAMESGSVVS